MQTSLFATKLWKGRTKQAEQRGPEPAQIGRFPELREDRMTKIANRLGRSVSKHGAGVKTGGRRWAAWPRQWWRDTIEKPEDRGYDYCKFGSVLHR